MLEIDVFNKARTWLAQESATVIQLVPPGGQAPLSLTFNVNGKLRTVFPDILALRRGVIWVGELKPKYDRNDHVKLKLIRDFASKQIQDICGRVSGQDLGSSLISYVLCHSDNRSLPCDVVYQWIFEPERVVPLEIGPLS